ncbi:hypothetical protein V5735_15565 (plasmid) [Haladaptatus sp. SPP-AMP-3]|uniref:hypothetical protein n=1 Tax=Haladaptatus sp. SPP-AMP-3 TaxID=3121295 RepID=UPI003C2E595F
MTFRSDDRGVTVQVGTILLFATLVVAMSLYQATAIPSQNQTVEFRHNERVQGQMQDVRNAIVRTGATGTGQPTSVTLGTQYPGHVLFVNPPPASGSLRTPKLGTTTVEHLSATDSETRDYFDGGGRSFSTRALVYAPNYNRYANAPDTVYENTVVYNRGRDGNATLTDQQLVHGTRITLVTVNGSLSRSQSGTVSLDPHALSPSTTATRTISVQSDGNDPVIRIPTTLGVEKWTRLLADQRYVQSVGSGADGTVAVTLKGRENGANVTYDLRMAAVGIGSNTTETNATYITNVSPKTETVNGTTTLVAEVRDRYNNPVSGVTVTSSDGGRTETTDEQGRVRFEYEATEPGTETVTLSIDDNGAERERVSFRIETASGGNGIGGGGTYDVEWVDAGGLDCTHDANGYPTVCTLDRSATSTHTLTANVTYGGDPVTDTTVDFGLNRTGVVSTSAKEATTGGDGRVQTIIDDSSTGDVKLLAASGGDADSVVVHVVQSGAMPKIVYNGDATATRGYRNGGPKSGVVFSVTNERPEDATLTDVHVEPHDATIDALSDPSYGTGIYESELYVSARRDGATDIGNGVSLPTTIDIDGDGQNLSPPFGQNPIIGGSNGTATFHLYQFERNGTPVEMTNEPVDVTLTFENHDPVSFTLDANDGGNGGGGGGQTTAYPGAFNDGDGALEYGEDPSIPPSNPEGGLEGFGNLDVDSNDNQVAALREYYRHPNGFEMSIGVSVSGIESRNHHTLVLGDYRTSGGGSHEVSVTPVDENGDPLGGSYTLSESSTTTRRIDLPQAVVEYVNDNGTLHLVFEDRNSNQDERLRIDYLSVESSND